MLRETKCGAFGVLVCMRRVAKQWRTAVSTFTYDAKDRLTQDATSAPLAHTYTYTYDSRDNILTNSESGSVVQMNYDAASRLTTSTAGGATTTYTFDSNGNLTGVNEAGTLTTMVYDKENRLKEHKQGAAANTRTFTYDLNSLKQSTRVGLVTDQLVWDGADMLGEVPAVKPVGAPTMPIRYNLAQGILFATTRFEPAPVRTDTGADFIGSILIDFDENGDYVAERRYKPYGELLAGASTTYGWTGNTGSRATLLQYAEQYNRRRHVSTKLKQWTTRDPLWPSESAYGYVKAGPLTWNDPSGLSPCSVAVTKWTLAGGGTSGLSRASMFRKCQMYSEQQFDARAQAGLAQLCPGGRLQICLECAKLTGLPISCEWHKAAQTRSCVESSWQVLVGGFVSFPFGNNLSKGKGTCIRACLLASGVVGDGVITKVTRQTCDFLCLQIRTGKDGCDRVFQSCSKYHQEKYRRDLCISFYLGVCFGL